MFDKNQRDIPGRLKKPFDFAKEFPPDRQIRAKQYMFPDIVEPAFHYKNPVSGRIPGELVNVRPGKQVYPK